MRTRIQHLAAWLVLALVSTAVEAQELRKIAELDVPMVGLSATVEPAAPVVPKGIASAVGLVVSSAGRRLSGPEVLELLGAGVTVRAELSGPGLTRTITIPQEGDPLPEDPLLLPLPALDVAGDYRLKREV